MVQMIDQISRDESAIRWPNTGNLQHSLLFCANNNREMPGDPKSIEW